ncbi:MAG: hypothetical protein IJA85_00970 [Clostridia bacterium]|nr:hypothetical protein [Clostridia bacterium]
MRKQILNGTDWTVSGWGRHQWHYEKSMELGNFSVPVIPAIPASVPGSVQTDLLRAGKIEDWNYGDNFRKIEWIEHREWVYVKKFTAQAAADKVLLHLAGLDFSGVVILNGEQVYAFEGMMLPNTVDITKQIKPEEENVLKVVFFQPPEVDGQVGYTSKVSILKSRYNYGWDWMPRLVNIGIFRDVWIEYADKLSIDDCRFKTELAGACGILTAAARVTAFEESTLQAVLTLKKDGAVIASAQENVTVHEGDNKLSPALQAEAVQLWNPNGFGEQPLYEAELVLIGADGKQLSEAGARVGFRSLSYTAPENAPEGCLPYNAVVNGRMIPIRGINWVPILPFYGAVTEEQYRFYIGRFKDMGCTVIRVWGGALQESEAFYSICDEMGIMVWQEFPQSSSGIDNAPNEDPAYIANLKVVAEEYIRRAGSHVCLTYWCGGNELYWGVEYFPADTTSDNLGMLKGVVDENMPEILFLPASPSHTENGARYGVDISNWVNGDCHGDWLYEGVDRHYDMIDRFHAMLYSEIGTPACARPEMLREYCTAGDVWPPDFTNPYWTDRGAWWILYKEQCALFGDFEGFGDKMLDKYAAAFRFIQAESLRSTVTSVRRCGKKKSGTIIWMGNEPFPNAANTSLLEMDGYTKPGYYAVKRGYSNITAGLRYETPYLKDEHSTSAELFICSDNDASFGEIKLTVYDEKCEVISQKLWKDVEASGVLELGRVDIEVKDSLSLVRLELDGRPYDDWVFTRGEYPFRALLTAPAAEVVCEILPECGVKVTNTGDCIAYYAELNAADEKGVPASFDNGYFCLLPGESRVCRADRQIAKVTAVVMN